MKFTLRYKHIFNALQHLPWHLHMVNMHASNYLKIRAYCEHQWGMPGDLWAVMGSTWYFKHEADAIQVMLTFS